ncbi:hypothetical protein RI129_007052 [Pyrocoelia pectoralis]|uniref:2-oxo-4-hydroxy-4-carboxy-5-ureidoimidazoline decarboxylase n=1 Tax=Pyrocoelia pectoralis TaxID=417401 RepID=A0AAN7ZI82_9COLE
MDPLFMNIDKVNKLPSEQFIKIFGNIVEHYPAAAIGILKNRPFRDVGAISDAVNSYLDSLSEHDKSFRYRVKFGFPYIICVREKNNTSEILDDIESRLSNGKEEELCTAIDEVKKICRLRLLTLIKQ